MGNRNFHTALLGGFRKKDVVNFLAEDKRQQEAALKDLQTQLDEAVQQIGDLMTERDSALETVQELLEHIFLPESLAEGMQLLEKAGIS